MHPTIVFNNQSLSWGTFGYVKTKIVVEDPKLIPQYKSKDAACADLIACIPEMVNNVPTNKKITLNHRTSAKIKTGIRVEVPLGYKLCISARNNLAEKGLLVSNAPGQYDSDSNEEIEVIVINAGREIVEIKDGDKFAQCWCEKVYRFDWDVVSELNKK